MVMARFPLDYNSFPEEDYMAGPVPLLFSLIPEAAIKQWKSSPEFAFRCLQALAARLVAAQNISR
jgi:hypothetical protein